MDSYFAFDELPISPGGLAQALGVHVLLAELGKVDVELRVVRLGLDAEFVLAYSSNRLMCSVRYGEM